MSNAGEFYVQNGQCHISYIGVTSDNSIENRSKITATLDGLGIAYTTNGTHILVAEEHKATLLAQEGAAEVDAPANHFISAAETAAAHRKGQTGPDGGNGFLAFA